MQALYVHIPFCVRKCGYCDFYSEAAGPADMDRYLAALERELELRVAEFGPLRPTTVFFGGGTPTRLSAAQLDRLGEALHRHADFSRVEEWTSEINPGTLDADKARVLAAMGVNRASFGVQSFDPERLRQLDRAHEAGKAESALALARGAGIANVSIDLIYALPGQTAAELDREIDRALALGTKHLSLYVLTFEDDTPLTLRMERGEIAPMPAEDEAALFEQTVARMRAAGYERYEVSNFARPGYRCRHNMLYWRCGDWLGIGPSAHSAHGRKRWSNAADHRRYAAMLLDEGALPVSMEEETTAEQRADELLLMGLRLADGVDDARMRRELGFGIAERCGPALTELADRGFIEWDTATLWLSDAGFPLLDRIVLELTRTPLHVGQ